MGINWGVRIRNRMFWLTAIPAAIIAVQCIAAIFGFQLDLTDMQDKLLAAADAVFALLAVLGVAVDMTTEGVGDSQRAMGYTMPYSDDNGLHVNNLNDDLEE